MMCDSLIPMHVVISIYSDPTWLRGVLIVVEDQNIRGGSLGGNDAVILGHVAGSVHLSLVVDLDLDLYFPTY